AAAVRKLPAAAHKRKAAADPSRGASGDARAIPLRDARAPARANPMADRRSSEPPPSPPRWRRGPGSGWRAGIESSSAWLAPLGSRRSAAAFGGASARRPAMPFVEHGIGSLLLLRRQLVVERLERRDQPLQRLVMRPGDRLVRLQVVD